MSDEQIFYIDEKGRKVSPQGEILEQQDPIQAKSEEPRGNAEAFAEVKAKADAKAAEEAKAAEAKAKAGK